MEDFKMLFLGAYAKNVSKIFTFGSGHTKDRRAFDKGLKVAPGTIL